MPSAHVQSISVLRDFRAAARVFLEEAEGSLQMIHAELQRAFEWIEHDRPAYWQSQLRRGFDQVSQARAALETCLLRTVADHRPSCIEEKQALAAAKRRLDHCREQIERVKAWNIRLHHDANEFRGRMSALRRVLDQDVPRLIALLERTLTILEEYAEVAPPSEETPAARQVAGTEAITPDAPAPATGPADDRPSP